MKNKLINVINFIKNFVQGNKSLVLKIIAVLIVLITIIVVKSCFTGKKYGNSFGNSNNLGLAAEYGKWIYYIDFDDNESAGIRKIKPNGKKSEKVIDGNISNLNVIDGYIYCIEEDDEGQNNLIRMKLNGKKKETLAKAIDANTINVTSKWVFYYKDGKLYRVSKTGEERKKISDKNISFYIIDNNLIYYIYTKSNSAYIAKMKLDGEESEKIAKADSGVKYECLNIKDGKIYYIQAEANKNYDYEYSLYSMNKKGEKIKKICIIDENVMYINMQDDKIYYTVSEDYSEYELRSIKYNGTNRETIKKDEFIVYINIIDKWIVCLGENDEDDYILRMISKDGKKEKII